MSDRAYYIKLSTIIAVKLLLIAGLWFLFVRGSQISVDTPRMLAHLGMPAHPADAVQ